MKPQVYEFLYPAKSGSTAQMPFLRWAGGKQWLSKAIAELAPLRYGRYFEPFFGGGSVFLALSPEKAILSDLNLSLIRTYISVRDFPENVIYQLSKWENHADTFYRIRSSHFTDEAKSAARMIYLNKTCWNGLYRVNKKGEFNVPYGKNPHRRTHDPSAIRHASLRLKKSQLVCGDFEIILADTKAGDFVYLDPPYTTTHSDNGFRRYNETLFSWDDQKRLAAVAHYLDRKGCFVILSNANYPDVLNLYTDFIPTIVERNNTLAANSIFRRPIKELLLFSHRFSGAIPMIAIGRQKNAHK